jgi:hypothetical protein
MSDSEQVLGGIEDTLAKGMWLVQIDTGDASFGLIVKGLVVVQAAPIAEWTVGKRMIDVTRYYREEKQATVTTIRLQATTQPDILDEDC